MLQGSKSGDLAEPTYLIIPASKSSSPNSHAKPADAPTDYSSSSELMFKPMNFQHTLSYSYQAMNEARNSSKQLRVPDGESFMAPRRVRVDEPGQQGAAGQGKRGFFNKSEQYLKTGSPYASERQAHRLNVPENEVIKEKLNHDRGGRTFFNKSKSPINRNPTELALGRPNLPTKIDRSPCHTPKARPAFLRENLPAANKKQFFLVPHNKSSRNVTGEPPQHTLPNLHLRNKSSMSNSTHKLELQTYTPTKIAMRKSKIEASLGEKPHRPSFLAHVKSTSQFVIMSLVGASRYGQAYSCLEIKTKAIFCLKKIRKTILKESPISLDEFIRKLSLRFRCCYPNIVQIYDIFSEGEFIYIVEQFMEGGNLRNYLSKERDLLVQTEPEQIKKQAVIIEKVYNITAALNYIHCRTNKTHGDLRPETILTSLGVCKISPGNLSKVDKNTQSEHYYIPPEVIAGQQATTKSDMWNLGLVLYELATNRHLFKVRQSAGDPSLTDQIINTNFELAIYSLPHVTHSLKDIIYQLLKVRPDERISSEQLMSSKVMELYGIRDETRQDSRVPASELGPVHSVSRATTYNVSKSIKKSNISSRSVNV